MTNTPRLRVRSIDLLRGMVMVLMALDHVRDYFSAFRYDPTDLEHTSPAMFFTRWITHFCAPVFILLSGCSAFLSLQKGKSKGEAARFLFIRGLWLILLELTLVRLGWQFNLNYQFSVLQVIWVIGLSMVLLSLLTYLPRAVILGLSLLMIFGHNLLDGLQTGPIWLTLLHAPGTLPSPEGSTILLMYPLIPWAGVMAAGYCMGSLFTEPQPQRDRKLYLIGGGAILLFLVLRFINIYGDPQPWQIQRNALFTGLSFLNVAKYPPSLLYLLMTLGPAICLMPLLEKWTGRLPEIITVYGRVPMFYYLLHLFLIHGMAMITGLAMGYPAALFTDMSRIFNDQSGWGFSLGMVYLWWLLAVTILYFPCRWFMNIKKTYRYWWLSYL